MHFEPEDYLIFECIVGSRLYGTNTENSDTDFRGVCKTPLEAVLDLFQGFEQKDGGFEEKDRTIYDLGKFMRLCADANPNIIEMLFIPSSHILMSTPAWDRLIENKGLFLSKKAKYTFSGYAISQLNDIKNHRQWFINPPKEKPTRKMFGLTDSPKVSGENIQAVANIKFEYLRADVADELRRELEYREEKRKWDNYVSWRDNRNPERRRLEELYGYDCYDNESTEFLSSNGWKTYDEIVSNNYLLGTVNPKTFSIEYQPYINKTDKIYDGTMYIVDPRSSKSFITENHNMFVSRCHRSRKNGFSDKYDCNYANWELIPMKTLVEDKYSHYHTLRNGICNRKDLDGISDDYLSLSGLFLSDGTFNFRNDELKCMRITQKSSEDFIAESDRLLEIYGMKKYIYKKETVWTLGGEVAKKLLLDYGHSKEKHLPSWCYKLSRRQVEIFFNSLLLGDGTESKIRNTYYCSSKILSDDIHAMLTSAGIFSCLYGGYAFKTSYGNTTMYHIAVPKDKDMFNCIDFHNIIDIDYDRKNKNGYQIKRANAKGKRVVCFEVENSTLITRNSGKVSIQGNCKHASHLLRLMTEGKELLLNGNITFPLPNCEEVRAIKNGKYQYEEILEMAESMDNEFELWYAQSELPHSPNKNKLSELYYQITTE